MNKTVDDFGAHTSQSGSKTATDGEKIVAYLDLHERVKVYSALASLLEAGVDLERAGSLLLHEYHRNDKPNSNDRRVAKAVETFFDGLPSASNTEEVVALANSSFGAAFLQPEERVVLSVLRSVNNPAALFRSAITILTASK